MRLAIPVCTSRICATPSLSTTKTTFTGLGLPVDALVGGSSLPFAATAAVAREESATLISPSRGAACCSFFFASREVTAWMGTITTLSWVAVEIDTALDIPGSADSGGTSRPTRTKKVVTSASVPGFLICAFFPTATTWPLNCLSGMASMSTADSSPTWTATTSCSPTSAFTSMSVSPPISITTSSEKSDPRMRSPTL